MARHAHRAAKWRLGVRMNRHEYIAQARLYASRGKDLPQAKLDADRVREIRKNRQGMTAKQLAAQFGVHYRTIEKIRHYHTWVHV